IYFFNAVHKTGVGWRDGSAIHYFLEQDRIVTRFGVFLRDHLSVAAKRALTYGAVATEHTLPWLIMSPLFFRWTRRVALVLALGLHGIIALCSRLGPFSYVMIIFYLIFLSGQDFAALGRWFGRESRRRLVIYDADCGICLWLARLLKRLDPFERLTFMGNDAPELPAGVTRELVERTLVVIDGRGRVQKEEQAVRSVLSALPGGALLGVWLLVPGLQKLGRALYRRVARRRLQISSAFGLAACGVPPPEPALSSAEPEPASGRTLQTDLGNTAALTREMLVALMAAVVLTQIAHDNPWLRQRISVSRAPWMTEIVDRARLIEGWGMFAPEPPYEDGRLVVDGRTKDGRKLDPFTGQAPDFDPYTPIGWGHDQLFCDYNNKLRFPWFSPHRQFLRDYLKHWHEYAGRPEDELASFDVWWVQDKSPKPGERRGQPLAPQKLVSDGVVKDSGAREWLARTHKSTKPAKAGASGARRP
ncbi:MAG TPA: DCC1-like thiol-disulfide oxidoreductase family protein, partial [Polyangiaceae bacterium]|nr:DCC1-like thiol-disulfide oxidoreductase family protein [Polyangiaceae bacterium]